MSNLHKLKAICLRLPPKLKYELDQLAQHEEMTLTALIQQLLREGLEKRAKEGKPNG